MKPSQPFFADVLIYRSTQDAEDRLARENAPSAVLRDIAFVLLVPLGLALAASLLAQ